MKTIPHRIRRQTWQVSVHSADTGFQLRSKLHNQWEFILPVFESAFNRVVDSNKIIRIPKLELKFKVSSEKELFDSLPKLLALQLNEKLRPLLEHESLALSKDSILWEETTLTQSKFENLMYYLQSGSLPWQVSFNEEINEKQEPRTPIAELKDLNTEQKQQIISYLQQHNQSDTFWFRLFQILGNKESTSLNTKAEGQIPYPWHKEYENLMHYLQSGSLPWMGGFNEGSENSDFQAPIITLIDIYIEQKQQIITYLQRHKQSVTFWFRLFQILGNKESINLTVQVASQIPYSWHKELILLLTTLFESGNQFFTTYTQITLAATILSGAITLQNSSVEPDFSFVSEATVMPANKKALLNFIAALPAPTFRFFAAFIKENKDEMPNLPEISSIVKSISLQEIQTDRNNNTDKLQDENLKNKLPHSEETKTDPLALKTSIPITEFSHKNITIRDVVENEINNQPESMMAEIASAIMPCAGLVILHPYISRLFENTGIKEAGRPELSIFVLPKAAALLHYMATGSEKIFEYELGFIKILLGLSPRMQLPVSEGLLLQTDKEEADAVLQSVVQYWTAIKNTSINGLRSTFIKRQGLLINDDGRWNLKIERKAFDLLLDQLPWSIGVIKLPWMTKAIFTEW